MMLASRLGYHSDVVAFLGLLFNLFRSDMDQSIRSRVTADDPDIDEAEEMDQNLASDRNDQDRDDKVLDEVSAEAG